MNAQLERHLEKLETFDSDEEYEEHLHDIDQGTDAGVIPDPVLNQWDKLKKRVRPIVAPRSVMDVLTKILWTLPIIIALSDYVGLWMSFNLVLIAVVLLQMRPEAVGRHPSFLTQYSSGYYSQSYENEGKSLLKPKKTVNDCRKEVSRLLGMIGAPPLQWSTATSDDTLEKEIQENCAKTTDSSIIAVVKFVEAHTQFLLAVDSAYFFLRQSSSIHLGLGPQSQCVERVERAAIARDYRNKRRRSSSAGSLILEGIKQPLVPQNGIDKSLLALSNVRRNLAISIVNQSESLQHILRGLEDFGSFQFSMQYIEPLELPDIVDLSWIKAARHLLAESLSICTESLCSVSVLESLSLSEEHDNRLRLDDSMCNARNAREHLLCTLLLGKKPIAAALDEPNDPLFRTLLNYRIHLDALGVALWSCQQFASRIEGEEQKEESLERLQEKLNWWEQVKQMGETCRAFEREITLDFFPEAYDEESSADELESATNRGASERESGDYVDGHIHAVSSEKHHKTPPTKTIVFSGKGSVNDRLKKSSGRQGSNPEGTANGNGKVPARDSVSERLMVNELQKRIQTMIPPEEEEEEVETDEEKAAKAARQPAAPLFLGASGSLLNELKLSIPSSDDNTGGTEFGGE